jgi:hypothetical protein
MNLYEISSNRGHTKRVEEPVVMPGPHVNGLLKIKTWSKVHNNDQNVLIFLVKD